MAPPQEVLDLHIAIVGAGMGGLATALALAKEGFTHIDVFESSSNLGFVGAGIQLAPNMARILDRLGVWAEVEREAVELKETSIRQGATDTELGHVDLAHIRQQYDYPHMVGHRSSLAQALYAGCKQHKSINFFFATEATDLHTPGPRPSFTAHPRKGGEPYTVTADLLLAADGVKSPLRTALLARQQLPSEIIDTGQAAYRILLSRAEMSSDPALLALIDGHAATRWIGPQRHIIAYPVSSNSIYNISTVQPDSNFAAAPSATYTTTGSKAEMLDVFADFDPLLRRMLDLAPDGEVCEWKLRVHAPLRRWSEAQTALLGDAAHATLPHMAQGAAQAVEDAAVLGVVLARLPAAGPAEVARALRVYERLRMGRAYWLVELAAANGRAMHLGEGEAKEERDRAFARLREGKGEGGVPDKWADAEVQREVYGVDVAKVAEEKFEELWAEV